MELQRVAVVEKNSVKAALDTRESAAVKIQAIIRAKIGREYFRRCLNQAMQEANEFWMKQILSAQLEIEKQRRAKALTQKVYFDFFIHGET